MHSSIPPRRTVRLSRPLRVLAVVAAAVVAGIAVTSSLPPGVGLVLAVIATLAAAALSGRGGEPGPDTPDGDCDGDGDD
jgi:hypothetical protein